MNDHYRTFFGFTKEPFANDIDRNQILKTPELLEVKDRFDYVMRLGAKIGRASCRERVCHRV